MNDEQGSETVEVLMGDNDSKLETQVAESEPSTP